MCRCVAEKSIFLNSIVPGQAEKYFFCMYRKRSEIETTNCTTRASTDAKPLRKRAKDEDLHIQTVKKINISGRTWPHSETACFSPHSSECCHNSCRSQASLPSHTIWYSATHPTTASATLSGLSVSKDKEQRHQKNLHLHVSTGAETNNEQVWELPSEAN